MPLRVALFPADESGCAFYRMEWPAVAAGREAGIEIVWCKPSIRKTVWENDLGDKREVPADIEADVLVFQRPMRGELVENVRTYKQRGYTCVLDIDDDFGCLHPLHPVRAFDTGENWSLGKEVYRLADMVTASTPALAERYGGDGRGVVLPNCVPEELLDMENASDGETLGWAGAWDFHPGDLEVVHSGVREALDRTGWHFKVLGPEGAERGLGLDETEATGWTKDISEYHRRLGTLDVSMVPLGESKFNEAKSYLKGIELAARGIPFVASSLPEYLVLAKEGLGLLAPPRGRNWRNQLLRLMKGEALRGEMSESGKQIVRDNHLYEKNGWRWAEAWQTAYDRKHALV